MPVSLALLLAACSSTPLSEPRQTTSPAPAHAAATAPVTPATDGRPFDIRQVTSLDNPWAMTFLPDGRALVTEKAGRLLLMTPQDGRSAVVDGTPDVVDSGQGGLADVVLGPRFDEDRTVYLSWVQRADGGKDPEATQGVVGKATLRPDGEPRLEGLKVIWRQDPAQGDAHYSLRLAVSPDGLNLFVTSGERQKMQPSQDVDTDLGKILRLTLDGSHVDDNPFVEQHEKAALVWSFGHRNPLGIAFDEVGNLWSSEMGPKGGDELNLVEPGANYGWPLHSEGTHYDGRPIPRHDRGKDRDVVPPAHSWVPSISPGNLVIYRGTTFRGWRGDALIGGLSGQCLVRVDLDGTTVKGTERWDMGARIREVEQGRDGTIWLLTDGDQGSLLHLTPAG